MILAICVCVSFGCVMEGKVGGGGGGVMKVLKKFGKK